MALSLCLLAVLRGLVLKLLLFRIAVFTTCVASHAHDVQPFFHDDESSELLQFKESFVIAHTASRYEAAYPKVLQWNSETRNCCSWDGVECDEHTGNVIGLDLSSSCLFGSINSNSTLFNLRHIRMLSLADNNFNHSQIPAAITQLSGLTYLNLSGSYFCGQVPFEISNLHMLTYLDLSHNYDPDTSEKFLQLKNPSLKTLVLNLTRLEVLYFSYINISSEVPHSFSNFTSLRWLLLEDCELRGAFPTKIFHLPNLQVLVVKHNENLSGHFPEFHERSTLLELGLGHTGFSGRLPSSIDKLDSLKILGITGCNFSGAIPHSLGKLAKITELRLGKNNFIDPIPSSFQNLTQLTFLNLYFNKITGSIPPWLGNLTKIEVLLLSENKLEGPIPQSVSKLMNLDELNLCLNNLSGFLEFDMFLNMKSLTSLQLGYNNLSLVFRKTNTNATMSKFNRLGLDFCNLTEFPNFLGYQNKLEWLDLAGNKIYGQIPKWVLNTSVDTLMGLNISSNFLTGFNQKSIVLPWVNLRLFDVSYNMLQGPLPIPPLSIQEFDVSNNKLNGEVSHLFCNMSSLYEFNLSKNNLSGMVPHCLGNSSTSLSVLSLENNSFHGVIPQICSNSGSASSLRLIDLSHNKFQGQLPRSWSYCMMLEGIVVSNNQLVDTFPSWLGSLPELKLLVLHHNGFYGVIEKPKMDVDQFAKLHVIDLSSNNFTGVFPSHYISSWNAMKSVESNGWEYMSAKWNDSWSNNSRLSNTDSYYKMTITSKGVDTIYQVILDVFAFVDLSNNKFEGEISDLFGKLKALRSLNLSNNMLTGCIPLSLGNLTYLESLDLSRNKLSGQIPQQLTQLGFVETFNVSHNNLVGLIPQGNQFNTFDASSFEGNRGLCGDQLFKKCATSSSSPSPFPTAEKDDGDSECLVKLVWGFVLAGYISGIVVGVALADIMINRRALSGWLRSYLTKMGKRN
ncbi:hypothetical protein FNV43_RR25475 [Rhamnella rubrinervis]|uniref:Leucine-rich repeat-containing N-terminal plant-type domain-containing protein n=1 Tax=Rhamnella rubrinervis TaxID=2594499 RepID=A0A8K0DNF4_9ROSA|nr:hypothetical protein FNV43_RR25475 [Rhamnella rubrinervis]